jgi:hypothetical protein
MASLPRPEFVTARRSEATRKRENPTFETPVAARSATVKYLYGNECAKQVMSDRL